uniref:DUF674 domain-containing protein n=1 Tax=Picea sitchensis TaxID=3332 RepID=A9NU73_PICSI|nr:unknown [Picea sitchensis]
MAADQSESTPKPKAANSMTIKLMVNKRSSKIMYAEAGKDFVDLLFSFLVLPAGAIAKHGLVSKVTKEEEQTKVPCITNLHKSVECLSSSIMKTDKGILLDPKVVSKIYTNDILCIQTPPPAVPPRYFVCNNVSYGSLAHSLSTQSGTVTCPCGYSVNLELKLADNSPVAAKDPVRPKGYVKETANFVITDDLSVLPVNSTATIFQLWNKLDVQEPTDLKEQNVTLGPNEVILLLKSAMVSDTVLNNVFKANSKV